MVGRTISHYRIDEKLGEGGMGVVYRAHDVDLDRPVAIKFLPPDLSRDADAVARFINEAKVASKLQHENICTIHEISQAEANAMGNRQLFIVMDCYDGNTLKDVLEGKPGGLPPLEAIDLVMQAARGIEAAHNNGIIHRDVKPSNIIVNRDGKVKVLDFGLARSIEHSGVTRIGQTPGTLAYMSPEQATGGRADHRTDIWSLGVLLFELVAGRRPFGADVGPSLVYRITKEQPPRLADIVSGCPASLDRIVRKALEKEPEKRYARAGEMLRDLQAVKEHIAAGGDSRLRVLLRMLRKPTIAIPGVLILLAVVGSGGWYAYRASKAAWARENLLPAIVRNAKEGDFLAAMKGALEMQKYDPSNPELIKILGEVTFDFPLMTNPDGARVSWRGMSPADTVWRFLGTTPLKDTRLVVDVVWVKVEREGYRTMLLPSMPFLTPNLNYIGNRFVLDPADGPHSGMVRVVGGRYEAYLTGIRTPSYQSLAYITLGEFLMDRYEVTNLEFKRFIDAGGYETKSYWKHPFVRDGRTVGWEGAMEEFRDRTGRPGPSTWEGGTYPEGTAAHPVGGVSWYEAAAYAEYAGKRLPSVNHVGVVGMWFMASNFIATSNLSGRGPVPVGSTGAMGPFGTFDIGGNVREWAWNPEGEEHYLLGGSWRDPGYMYFNPRKAPAFDRSADNGFRCMVSVHPEADQAETWDTLYAVRPKRDYLKETPVDDRTFGILQGMFLYEKTDLRPRIESRDTSNPEWVREFVTIDAAYGGERYGVYIFLPKAGAPPYQSVVYYPCADAFNWDTSSPHLELGYTSFVVAGGRALIYPVYNGTYERKVPEEKTMTEYRDNVVKRVKDLSRALDYIETRKDFDQGKIAYETYSWGSQTVIALAVEPRIRTAILIGGGFVQGKIDKNFPELDLVNFAPRVKQPVLLINGLYDMLFPYETAHKPAYLLLGTPPADKKDASLKTDHIIARQDVARELLPWLDRYLGPVRKSR